MLLLLLAAGTLFGGERTARRKKAMPQAPAIEITMRADNLAELSWAKCKGNVYLERKLGTDELFAPVRMFTPEEQSYTDSAVASEAFVMYRLRPVNARYLSEYGPVATVNTELPFPPRPLLARVAVDSVEVRITDWIGLTDSVVVERRIEGLYTGVGYLSPAQSAFRDGGLHSAFFQYYRLRCQRSGHEGPPSPHDSVLMDVPPPHELSVTLRNDHTAQLTWRSALPYPSLFEVEKRTSSGIHLFRTAFGDTVWTDADLGYEQRTYYRVRVRNGKDSSEFTPPVLTYYSLYAVDSLHLDPVHDLFVHLTWHCPDSLTQRFLLERSADSTQFQTLAELSGRTFAYVDTLASRGQTYYYRITSFGSNRLTKRSAIATEPVPIIDAGMVEVPADSGRAAFLMDALEISVADYAEFCRETNRELPADPGFPDYPDYWLTYPGLPAVHLSWRDAIEFCNWRSLCLGLQPAYDSTAHLLPEANGYSLANRQEFIRALISVADTTANLMNADQLQGLPVACKSQELHPSAIRNLIGNVWEWNEEIIADSARLILGGAYCTPRPLAVTLPEFCYKPDFTSPTIGFRCVLRKPPSRATGS